MDILLVVLCSTILIALVVLLLRGGGSRAGLGELRESITSRLAEERSHSEQRLENFRKAIEERIIAVDRSHQTVGERLDNAAKVVGEVKEKLGGLESASKQIFDVGKDIASLQEILQSPKTRGGMGEFLLGEVLSQILPKEHYTLQHHQPDGLIVDAAVRIGGKIVPVDAKFPLENFRRLAEANTDDERKTHRKAFIKDVRKHISSISEKYIRPEYDTYEFALMYVPAENVYYEAIIRYDEDGVDLFSESVDKRVVPVSPNSFLAYLRTIVTGLRGFEIEKRAQQIQQGIAAVVADIERFDDSFRKLGTHLENARKQYDESDRKRARIGDRVDALGGGQLPPGGAEPSQEKLSLE
jgi:DNA recombination protein RmuC